MNLKKLYPREYNSFNNMRQRCNNPKSTVYRYYGGRGIFCDPSWSSFSKFLEDMGVRPEGTSLDRINTNGNYCKENCRWSTHTEQNLNQRDRAGREGKLRGAYKRPNGKYESAIVINKKRIHLGDYDTEQEAHERFIQERKKRQATQRVCLPTKANEETSGNTK